MEKIPVICGLHDSRAEKPLIMMKEERVQKLQKELRGYSVLRLRALLQHDDVYDPPRRKMIAHLIDQIEQWNECKKSLQGG